MGVGEHQWGGPGRGRWPTPRAPREAHSPLGTKQGGSGGEGHPGLALGSHGPCALCPLQAAAQLPVGNVRDIARWQEAGQGLVLNLISMPGASSPCLAFPGPFGYRVAPALSLCPACLSVFKVRVPVAPSCDIVT